MVLKWVDWRDKLLVLRKDAWLVAQWVDLLEMLALTLEVWMAQQLVVEMVVEWVVQMVEMWALKASSSVEYLVGKLDHHEVVLLVVQKVDLSGNEIW